LANVLIITEYCVYRSPGVSEAEGKPLVRTGFDSF